MPQDDEALRFAEEMAQSTRLYQDAVHAYLTWAGLAS